MDKLMNMFLMYNMQNSGQAVGAPLKSKPEDRIMTNGAALTPTTHAEPMQLRKLDDDNIVQPSKSLLA